MKRLPTVNIAHGQLAVHRVVSELIGRGHQPYLPVMDYGIDILLGSGIRLQVKSTLRQTQHYRFAGSWMFSLHRSQRIVQRKYVKSAPRQFSREVDFVILHAIEANRFWVVPAVALDGRATLLFKDGAKQWKDCDVEEAKRLRAEGLSYTAIAQTLGMTDHHTVMRRLKGTTTPKRNYMNMVQYENRWDLITGALATLREANTIVAPAGSLEKKTVSQGVFNA